MPHTADRIVEAWAPTREECIAEAVQGLVECFADVADATPTRMLPYSFPPAPDDALLVAVLEEALCVFEIFGVVPVATHVEAAEDGGVVGSFDTVDATTAELVGSVPKAVTLHGLEFRHGDGWHGWHGWHCLVLIDV